MRLVSLMNVDSPIILAVDTTDLANARSLIEATRPYIGIYKFGLEFYLRHGLSTLKEIKHELLDNFRGKSITHEAKITAV